MTTYEHKPRAPGMPTSVNEPRLSPEQSFLSLSLDDWNGVWRSRHHIMSRLATTHRVLFASPPFYIRDVVRWRTDAAPSGISAVQEKLHSYTPPRWLPTNYRWPTVDRMIEKFRYARLRRALDDLDMRHPILYVWHPALADAVGHFGESLVVYHVYDEYLSFRMTPDQKAALQAQERRLLKRADVVFAASEALSERRRQYNPATYTVGNGVDYALFSQARDDATPVAVDLAGIPHPIIGCVSTQTAFMDLRLLEAVFRRRSDWSFVFVGVERTRAADAGPDLAALQALPNVHFLGHRSLGELPRYLKAFDVCALPYAMTDVTLVASSPLKLYEFMAAGKPIVCKPLPLPPAARPLVEFADEADDWISATERALGDADPQRVAARQAEASANTWEQRVEYISAKIAERLSAHAPHTVSHMTGVDQRSAH
jgi:glycosyltransferase involved in cell wall biosynthesis